jgi:hypothetical protein
MELIPSVGFPSAEVLPAALDQQPEHERGFAHEGEPGDVHRVIGDKHGSEPVGEVSETGNDEQDAEDSWDEIGSIRQEAEQQQVNAEEDKTDVPDRVVGIDRA